MDDDVSGSLRRMSTRSRKVAPKMAAALASSDNRTQAALARLEALENDNAGIETVEVIDDDDASLDDDDDEGFIQRKHSASKRKTRQAKARENAKKLRDLFSSWCTRQTWRPCPLMCPAISGQPWGPQAPPPAATFAPSAASPPITLVFDAVFDSAVSAAKTYTMIPAV